MRSCARICADLRRVALTAQKSLLFSRDENAEIYVRAEEYLSYAPALGFCMRMRECMWAMARVRAFAKACWRALECVGVHARLLEVRRMHSLTKKDAAWATTSCVLA